MTPFNPFANLPGCRNATYVVTSFPGLASGHSVVQALLWPDFPAEGIESPKPLPVSKTPVLSIPSDIEGQRLSIPQAAAIAGVGKRTVEAWIAGKRLQSVKSGRRRLIERRDLDAYMEREKRATLRNRR